MGRPMSRRALSSAQARIAGQYTANLRYDAAIREAQARSLAGPPPAGSISQEKLAARMEILQERRLLPALAQGQQVTVRLPGGIQGTATGVNAEGCVVVEGFDQPFLPDNVTPL